MRPAGVLILFAVSLAPAAVLGQSAPGGVAAPVPSLYGDDRVFVDSIAMAEKQSVAARRVSGITVPHHLLAADLIARAFLVARANAYDKIVVLSPDHFKRARRPFATTRRAFATVFGPIPASAADIERLLAHSALVEESDLFEKEHGIAAVLPYIRRFFPATPIVPIAVSIGSTREEWDEMVVALEAIVTARTLIVQSTDFSHYLPLSEAILRDQEVLNILSAGDIEAVANLKQPQHLDSRGSQYIQMRLQEKRFGARPVVIANTNMQFYTGRVEAETTSYVVQIYPTPEDARRVDAAGYADGAMICMAGDTFFGRYLAPLLARPDVRIRLLAEIEAVLQRCPLIVNLEGVIVPEIPTGLGPMMLAMPGDLTVDWLKTLNVVAASLANNHSNDLGEEARADMAKRLRAAGIAVLDHGEAVDLGLFRVIALSDLDNRGAPRTGIITDEELDRVTRSEAAPPLAAFMHWGREFDDRPGAREEALVDALRRAAVSLIVGAHPHVASQGIVALAGGEALLAYSLGNFLFDQPGDKSTGAVLEVRFFPQGTFFTRLIPIPNFYDRALEMR
jgi:poly-gamma-glutamate synthesis protein (capsule biosynthesis protein)